MIAGTLDPSRAQRAGRDCRAIGTLVNLDAEYKLRDNITLFGRVENLFDANYEEVFSYATPGIGAYAGLRVKL